MIKNRISSFFGITVDGGTLPEGATEALWRGRRVIAFATLVVTACAITYAFLAKELYRSEALVQPRQETLGGGTLSGASLASLPWFLANGGGERAIAVATLRSRTVVEALIEERKLLPKLYPERWDSESNKWKTSEIPTVWQAYNDFTKRVLAITDDRRSGLLTVAVEWEDPKEAQIIVTELIARTNQHLKKIAVEEGEKHLSYLEEQSKRIGQVELQQALFGLVEGEMKSVMIAKGSDEFAIKTIDAAVVPQKRAWPKRRQIVYLGALAGLFLGVVFVLSRHALLVGIEHGRNAAPK